MVPCRVVSGLQGMRRSSFGEYRAQLARHEGACGTVFAGMEVMKFSVR